MGNMVVGGEKRPAPSSVSAYGFDDDDEEDEDDEGGEGVGHGGPTQCQPSASKRSRRSGLGKRLKGSPASGPVCPGAGSPAQGSSAALASRPAVTPSPPLQGCSSWDDRGGEEHSDRGGGGYNSEDEYSHLGLNLTDEEWEAKDRRFEKAMRKKGYVIKRMVDDGSCLFRAVADQVRHWNCLLVNCVHVEPCLAGLWRSGNAQRGSVSLHGLHTPELRLLLPVYHGGYRHLRG